MKLLFSGNGSACHFKKVDFKKVERHVYKQQFHKNICLLSKYTQILIFLNETTGYAMLVHSLWFVSNGL